MAVVARKPVALRDHLRKHYTYLVQELIVSNYLNDFYEQYMFPQLKRRIDWMYVVPGIQRQAELSLDILKRKSEDKSRYSSIS